MKKLIISLIALMLVIPVSSFAKLKAPDVLDKEKIMTDESLSKYKSIGVKIFSTEGIEYESVDDEEMVKMKHFLKECQEKLAKTIKNDLEDNGVKAFVIDEDGGKAGKADMIIEGKITKINLGSAAGRIIFGFGAGQAGLTVEGELKDGKSGDTLVKFEHENTSGLGSGDKWSLVSHEAEDLGDKIAEFIKKLSK
jgi:hypothetical protein